MSAKTPKGKSRAEQAATRPVQVEPLRARAIRGPREDGRYYWQVRLHRDGLVAGVFSTWATRKEVSAQMVARVAAGFDSQTSAASMPRAGEVAAPAAPEGPPAAEVPRIRTLKDVIEFWFGWQEERLERLEIAERSLATYRWAARRLVRTLGDVPVADVNQGTMKLLQERAGAGVHAQTLQHLRVSLKAAWDWAGEQGLVPRVTLKTPQMARVPKVRRRVAEQSDFWAAVDATEMGWPKTMMMILGLTGCRPMEAARLRWSDFDAEVGSLRIGPHDDEGNDGGKHPRTVMVPPLLVKYLLEWRAATCPKNEEENLTGPISRFTKVIWHRRIDWKAAGVAYTVGYDFRRMFSEAYMRAGTDPAVYENQMGHSWRLALARYRQFSEKASSDALKAAGIGERVQQGAKTDRGEPDPEGDPKRDPESGGDGHET